MRLIAEFLSSSEPQGGAGGTGIARGLLKRLVIQPFLWLQRGKFWGSVAQQVKLNMAGRQTRATRIRNST